MARVLHGDHLVSHGACIAAAVELLGAVRRDDDAAFMVALDKLERARRVHGGVKVKIRTAIREAFADEDMARGAKCARQIRELTGADDATVEASFVRALPEVNTYRVETFARACMTLEGAA